MKKSKEQVSKNNQIIKVRSSKMSEKLFKEKKQAELLEKINKVTKRMDSHNREIPEETKSNLNNYEINRLKEMYKQIDLAHVLLKLDAEKKSKGRWKIPGCGMLIYQEEMQTWKIVTGVHNGEKGFSGLQLVKKVLDLDEMSTLSWMNNNFGSEISPELKFDIEVAIQKSSAGKKDYSPPNDYPDNIQYVIDYLTEDRGIPLSLINKMVESHKIYSDYDKRCVFVSSASAEIRSTPFSSEEFKGTCSGGQKDISGFSVMPEFKANEKTGVLVEAAVDALSYNALYPGRYVLSTNGSGMFELQYKATLELLENGFNVISAYDADLAGDTAAQTIFNALYLREKFKKDYPSMDINEFDQAFISGKIKLKIDESPHHLFDSKFEEKLPVFIRNEKNKEEWLDTGKLDFPEISYEVNTDIAGLIKHGKYQQKVYKNEYFEFKNNVLLKRDRPVMAKDWNEELKKLGSEYIRRYEICAENDFKMVPELPSYLEKNRLPTQEIIVDEDNNIVVDNKKETKLLKNNVIPLINEKNKIDNIFVEQNQQEVFNSLCLRYYIKNRSGLDVNYNTIDDFIKNKVNFYISDSPHLNFMDKPWQNEQPLIREEDGKKVISAMIKPTVRATFLEDFGNIKKGTIPIKINEKTFFGINKFMDKMYEEFVKSEDKNVFLKESNLNFFKISETGNRLDEVLGKGNLLNFQKEKKVNQESIEPIKRKM